MDRTEFLKAILITELVDCAVCAGVWLGYGDNIWDFNFYQRAEIYRFCTENVVD